MYSTALADPDIRQREGGQIYTFIVPKTFFYLSPESFFSIHQIP